MTDSPLETLLQHVLQRLQAAPASANEPWRTPALATLDAQGMPAMRTVVLRAYHERYLEFHTDTRSAKWHELGKSRQAAWCFWDPESKEQLRIQGLCTLHHQNAVTREAWGQLPAHTQASYGLAAAPKTPIPNSAEFEFRDDLQDAHFGVIHCAPASIDWLKLGRPKHKRAQFTWIQGVWQSTWLVP